MKKLYAIVMSLAAMLTGQAQNPSLLKDVFPGATGSGIQQFVKTTNYTFFNADDNDADADRGLFRTDGTAAGTIKLNLQSPTYNSTKAEKLTALGNKVIFVGDHFPPNYGEVWVSDGTQAGTFGLERFQPNPGTNRGVIFELVEMNGYVYYAVTANNNKTQIRRTDGTPAGTSLVYEFTSYATAPEAGLMTAYNGVIYFNVYDITGAGNDMVWRTDGTAAGTYMIKDYGQDNFVMGNFTPIGNSVLQMTAKVNPVVCELQKIDTATGNVSVLKTFNTAWNNNNYPQFGYLDGQVYLSIHDGVNGKELWKSDGTVSGTVLVNDINPGALSSTPINFTLLNNTLYFSATTASNGTELWKFNGVNASLVKDINPGVASSGPGLFSVANNNLVFRAVAGNAGAELWISDGSAANTVQVADIYPGAGAGINGPLVANGNKVFFVGNNGGSGQEPFMFDNNAGIAGVQRIYVNDGSQVNDVFTTGVGNNNNPGTAALPVASIGQALFMATPGTTIYVDAGTYVEQVYIDKSVTIKGAGRTFTTLAPSGNLSPLPPSQFQEIGIIQSMPGIGDVHITDIAIDGFNTPNDQHSALIQGGGSMTNCEMRNVNNGPYFRDPTAVNATAIISGNTIHHVAYCGILLAGSNLTCVVTNNNIDHSNSVYGMAFLVAFDLAPIPSFTATGNIITNYSGWGIQGHILSGSITNNSITGSGGPAVSFSAPAPIPANCNWYGSDDYAVVGPKVTGNVTYSPWLVSGVDAQPTIDGFQPVANTCTGLPYRNIYVNDGSNSGDVFTTATGNDATGNGSVSSPYATVSKAISMSVNGDRIYVDAGIYVDSIVVNKQLTLRGAKYGQIPGASLDRGNETILRPSFNNTALVASVINITTSNVVVDGFTVDGDNPLLSGGVGLNGADINAGSGIFNGNIAIAKMMVYNNIVKNTAQYGIYQSNSAGTAVAGAGTLIRHNRVDNINSRGIGLNASAYGSINDNVISRAVQNGIRMANFFNASPDGSTVVIAGNKIDAVGTGIFAGNHTAVGPRTIIMMNEINLVPGSGIGIDLTSGPTAGSSITFNKITGGLNSLQGTNSSGVGTHDVNNNSFTGYSNRAIFQTGVMPINASCNWFGTADQFQVPSKVAGLVSYLPWLTNGTDTQLAVPGFQPAENSCNGVPKYYVNDGSTNGDVFTSLTGDDITGNGSPSAPFLTLTKAYEIAQPGDSIYVDAGSYDLGGLTYSFSKAVKLVGSNFNISPNSPANKEQYNMGRNAESILLNGKMNILTSNLSMVGFTIVPGSRNVVELINTATMVNDYGGFEFSKNKVSINSGNVPILINGKVASNIATLSTSGFNITDNRFEKTDLGPSTTIILNNIKNAQITDNSFVTVGHTSRIQNAIQTGINPNYADSIQIFGNTIVNANVAFGANKVANSFINNNSITNSANVYNTNNDLPGMVYTELLNNTASNAAGGSPAVIYLRQGGNGPGSFTVLKAENNVFNSIPTFDLNQLFGGFIVTVNNTVQNGFILINKNKLSFNGDFSVVQSQFVRPISLRGNISIAGIDSNEITMNNTAGTMSPIPIGTALPANPAITLGTDFSAAATMSSSAQFFVENNKISGFKQGIVTYDAGNHTASPYTGYGNVPAGASININNNSILADSVSINNGSIGAAIQATCNWYGSTLQTDLVNKVKGTVNYQPWLTNGTDASANLGFQPSLNSCNGTAISISTISSNVNCYNASNGSISVTVAGGVLPYAFAWSKDGQPFSNQEDLANLSPGVYALSVTDAVGNTLTLDPSVTITQPAAPVLATITNLSTNCSNNATVTITGGTEAGAYDILWSNGSTSSSVNNLPAGLYTVTVTDDNGCIDTAMVNLTVAEAFNPSASVVNVSCAGGNNGSITVTNVNAGGDLFFSIDGGNFEPGTLPYTFNGLSVGSYTIAVKTTDNCVGFVTKTITAPAPISISLTGTSVCSGTNNGIITTVSTGGSGAHSYSWSGPNNFVSTQKNISGLAAGPYVVTVTDNRGCTVSQTIVLTALPDVNTFITAYPIACRSIASGSITTSATGGSGAGFSYLWNTGATTQTLNNLVAGTYTVTITDNGNGCTYSRTAIITQPASNLALTVTKLNSTGCALGTITASASGGTAGYKYSLDGTQYQNSGTFLQVQAGSYTVWAKDANGCIITKPVALTDNGSDAYEGNNSKNQAKPFNVGELVNARLAVATDLADWFRFTPSTSGVYAVSLNHLDASFAMELYPAGNNTPALTASAGSGMYKEYNLMAGATYYLRITGGLSYLCYTLQVATPTSFTKATEKESVQPVEKAAAVLAYPNPHRGAFTLKIETPVAGKAVIEIINATGQKLLQQSNNMQVGSNLVTFRSMPSGVLIYRLMLNGKMITGKITGAQ